MLSRLLLALLACSLALFLTPHRALAEEKPHSLELSAPFTSNMILQRQKAVPVWGFDTPGSTVTVEFAGQKVSGVTDARGDWRVSLKPLTASAEERSFTVTSSSGERIELGGVLVGEVWFSSGQSNMVWVAGKSMCRDLAATLSKAEEELPIREININTVSAIYPQKRATSDGGWKKVRGASGFSALSLSFAHELYKELKVPVGILLSAHSNTRVEAFARREAFEAHEKLAADAALIHAGDVLTEAGREAFAQYERDLRAWQKDAIASSQAGADIPPRPPLPGIAGMWRGPSQFFSGKIHPVVPYAVRGAIWCQGTSNSRDGKIYAARMEALVRGWREAWAMPKMPFYFTQMQAYGGAPDPDNVGFADIRQAQFRFFLDNRDNVGMVVQTDLNSARPGGIHYFNKLHPGMRLARWALAHEYGRDIAFTGPIYKGYRVEGEKVVVLFEPESLYGGLMVGSKGMASDYREAEKYVEPARPTPGEQLAHFRLCGADGVWHAADAKIAGDTVVVTAEAVPAPVGVQYAFSAVPMNSNLYNKAGLPATPFAAINGELIFQEDLTPRQPARAPDEPAPVRPMLHVGNYYRPGVVLQRNQPIPVWGHANAGAEVTVTLGSTVRTVTADELEQWSVRMPPMKASATPITLRVETSMDRMAEVRGILVGDVWYLTGTGLLSGEMAHNPRDKEAPLPEALPLVREFKRNTKASSDSKPRKRRFETGGGKYRSHWLPADYAANEKGVSMFAYTFAKALGRDGIPQGFVTMSSGRQMASPLSWTSYQGLEGVSAPAFKKRLDELRLLYPESAVAKAALEQHLEEVHATIAEIQAIARQGGDLSTAPLRYPGFPQPGGDPDVPRDAVPTYTYNWCVSPLTPMAVAGVIWVPGPSSIGYSPADYGAELEVYARSLPGTYGQETVPFFYAQPSEKLVEGITAPDLPGARSIILDAWPKSLKGVAEKLAETVKLAE